MSGAMNYCGFSYEADGRGYYHITPDKEIAKPKTFFKYYALSDFSVDALTNMYIYATHPNQFNDPFDCNEKLIKFDSWVDVKRLWDVLFVQFQNDHPNLEEACRESEKAFKTLLYRNLGLVSLAPVRNNYTMWALYSQNSGFCVEFDTNQFPFRHFGPFPINYVDIIPGPIHIGEAGGSLSMLVQTNVKNLWWEYENEWRLYIPSPDGFDMQSFGKGAEQFNKMGDHDRKFKYPISSLKSITLGKSFFDKLTTNMISISEVDVVCDPQKNRLENQVLDFLSKLQDVSKTQVLMIMPYGFSKHLFIEMCIVNYSENKYRLIECNSNPIIQ